MADRKTDYKLIIRAPKDLDDPASPDVYYEVETSKWQPIPTEGTGALRQLAGLGAHVANVPLGKFLGGACVFVNMRLIVDNELTNPAEDP